MRKIVIFAMLGLAVFNLSAQPITRQTAQTKPEQIVDEQPANTPALPKSDDGYQYRKGTLVFNAGVSVGLIGYSNYGYVGGSGFLPVTISGEYSLDEMFAASAYFGFYGQSYGDGAFAYHVTTFGGRLVAHATDFLNDKANMKLPAKLDLYATLILGYRVYSWSSNDNSPLPSTTGNVTFGPALGARYMFIKNLGVYLEVGRGPFGLLATGVSLKF